MLNGTRPPDDSANGIVAEWRAPRVSHLPCVGPFAATASLLLQAGYSPIPIEPGDKRPLAALGGWDRLRTTPLTLDAIAVFEATHPNAGVGVAGGFSGLVPIDFDTEDEDILAAVRSALPEPLVDKKGRRGVTSFFYDPSGSIKARKFKDVRGAMLVEILTTGQSVIPPTSHPETAKPYRWLTECTLLDVQATELPKLSPQVIERLEKVLQPWLAPTRRYVQRTPTISQPPSSERMRAYAEAARDSEVRALSKASKGGRNHHLFQSACRLGKYVHHGVLDESQVVEPLLEGAASNGLLADDGRRGCENTIASGLRKAEGDHLPLLEDQIIPGSHTEVTAAARTKREGASRPTQATDLIEIATADDVELFHSPDGTTFADIVINGHRETWPTKSSGFRRWLRRAYYQKTGGAPNGESMSTALALIEAHAQFGGVERTVYLRVAPHNESIYIDLGDDAWRAIEIDGDGWRIVNSPPVRFRRTPGMLSLPMPLLGGKIEELKKHLNLTQEAFVLAVGWLLQVLRGRGPYPTLALNGEQGAGKTTAADRLRRLVDPHAAPLRALPRDVRDLAIAANNAHVLAFDNLSGIPPEVADALCRLSTGGGFATRALYSDDEERIFDGQRPVVMTSIVDVATRADLADRTLVALLTAITEQERKTDREVRESFEAAAPHILGALLDAVAHGLKRECGIRLNRLPRMADHAVWVRACETAFQAEGRHLEIYDQNRAEAAEIVLESDQVAMALRSHMDPCQESTTTSTDLLKTLGDIVPDHVRRSKDWPPNARALSGRLRRLAPALRGIGIVMAFAREGHDRRRMIEIKKVGAAA